MDRPAGQAMGGQLVVQSTKGIDKAKRYAEEFSKTIALQAELAAQYVGFDFFLFFTHQYHYSILTQHQHQHQHQQGEIHCRA